MFDVELFSLQMFLDTQSKVNFTSTPFTYKVIETWKIKVA